MTRQDFELIARVVRSLPEDARVVVFEAFVSELVTTNPRFNSTRFMLACLGDAKKTKATKREGEF